MATSDTDGSVAESLWESSVALAATHASHQLRNVACVTSCKSLSLSLSVGRTGALFTLACFSSSTSTSPLSITSSASASRLATSSTGKPVAEIKFGNVDAKSVRKQRLKDSWSSTERPVARMNSKLFFLFKKKVVHAGFEGRLMRTVDKFSMSPSPSASDSPRKLKASQNLSPIAERSNTSASST